MKPKVVYVFSKITDRATQFEWLLDTPLATNVDLSFVVLNARPALIDASLRARGADVTFIPYQGKRDLPSATRALAAHLRRIGARTIHTHLQDANLVGLTAATLAGVPQRVYTRHHTSHNRVHHPHAVWYDRYANRMATHVVATSDNVRTYLRTAEAVPDRKIRTVNFGLPVERFADPAAAAIDALRRKYGTEGRGPVVGASARYVEWKGLQYVIRAFEQVRDRHPDALLLLFNAGSTPYAPVLRQLLGRLPARSYQEIELEEDLYGYYHLFDVYVHTPVDPVSEAFGQTYIESLAARRPAVFTLSGIAPEFVTHEHNALVVPFHCSRAIADAVGRLLADRPLAHRLAAQGLDDVRTRFGLHRMTEALGALYS
jgi:glycosyltransferase involved in cell wall biosynthesis